MLDAERLVEFLIGELNSVEGGEVCHHFAEHLRQEGWFVAEDEDELQDLALDNTDLVEPE